MSGIDINPVYTPPHQGGGMFGSVLGGVLGALAGTAGAVLAPWTAGASLALIPAGYSIGQTVGGYVGGATDKAKSGAVSLNVPKAQEKGPMGSMGSMPEVQMATMQNAKNLLSTSSIPGAEDYMNQLDQANALVKKRLGDNSSIF